MSVCKISFLYSWILTCIYVQLFEILWTIAHQALLSMGFSRQEYWGGLPCLPPEDLPNPGTEPRSLTLQVDSLPPEQPGRPNIWSGVYLNYFLTSDVVLPAGKISWSFGSGCMAELCRFGSSAEDYPLLWRRSQVTVSLWLRQILSSRGP